MEGEELTAKARVIKGTDEIKTMRCASHAGETAVCAMEDAARSGVPSVQISEDDIWAVLHAENIRRDGKWIEIRLLAPGVSIRSLSENGHHLRDYYQMQKYGCIMHGVGLCDEWPYTAYPNQLVDGAFEYELEAGMVLCVEALVSPEGGDFSIKLEDQVLITEDGFENLTTYEVDRVLMGGDALLQ